jgi:hypothetical protein
VNGPAPAAADTGALSRRKQGGGPRLASIDHLRKRDRGQLRQISLAGGGVSRIQVIRSAFVAQSKIK